jgi:hypothetical protein
MLKLSEVAILVRAKPFVQLISANNKVSLKIKVEYGRMKRLQRFYKVLTYFSNLEGQ